MTELWVQRRRLRVATLQLRGLPSLRRVFVAKHVFEKLRGFALEELPALESLWVADDNDAAERARSGVFAVAECPLLRSLRVGDGSFRAFGVFSLRSLPTLETLCIGDGCFQEVARLRVASGGWEGVIRRFAAIAISLCGRGVVPECARGSAGE